MRVERRGVHARQPEQLLRPRLEQREEGGAAARMLADDTCDEIVERRGPRPRHRSRAWRSRDRPVRARRRARALRRSACGARPPCFPSALAKPPSALRQRRGRLVETARIVRLGLDAALDRPTAAPELGEARTDQLRPRLQHGALAGDRGFRAVRCSRGRRRRAVPDAASAPLGVGRGARPGARRPGRIAPSTTVGVAAGAPRSGSASRSRGDRARRRGRRRARRSRRRSGSRSGRRRPGSCVGARRSPPVGVRTADRGWSRRRCRASPSSRSGGSPSPVHRRRGRDRRRRRRGKLAVRRASVAAVRVAVVALLAGIEHAVTAALATAGA